MDSSRRDTAGLASGFKELSVFHGQNSKQEKAQPNPPEPLPYYCSAMGTPPPLALGLGEDRSICNTPPRSLNLCKGAGQRDSSLAKREFFSIAGAPGWLGVHRLPHRLMEPPDWFSSLPGPQFQPGVGGMASTGVAAP